MAEQGMDWSRHWGRASDLGIGAARVDVKHYTRPEAFEEEREKIFRRTWIPVARTSEIAEPGDFLRRDFPPLETEALIVRDRGGVLRAFYNRCPHRGATVVRVDAGRANLFVCPYHAWSFGTDGHCKAIPGADEFPHVDKCEMGLTSIHLDVWNGFIFLNFAEQPPQGLHEYLGEFAELFGDIPFHSCSHAVEITMDLATNWKNFADAFNEGYHVSVLHQKTLPMVPSRSNPLNTFYDPIFSAPHSSVTVQSNPDWVPTGDVRLFVYAASGAAVVATDATGHGAAEPLFTEGKGINRVGLPNFALQFLNLFPLTHIEVFPNRFMWYQFWPTSVDRTRLSLRMYAREKPNSWLSAFTEGHMVATTRDIVTEDLAMTRIQQLGMKGGGFKQLWLGENEFLLRFMAEIVDDYRQGRR